MSDTLRAPGAKLGQSVKLVIFTVLALLMVICVARATYDLGRAYFWRSTPCLILSSEVKLHGQLYVFEATYQYTLDLREYNSKYVGGASSDYNRAQRLMDRYPVGAAATCYVNWPNPGESILRRPGLDSVIMLSILLAVPTMFVLVGVVFLWTLSGKDAGSPGLQDPPPKPGRFDLTMAVPALLVLVFFICLPAIVFSAFTIGGAADLYLNCIKPLRQRADSRGWTQTPCVVVSSRVMTLRKGPRYRADILYSYRVGDREYRSNHYLIFEYGSRDYDSQAAIVQRFPTGTQSVCCVNPADPTEAVLVRNVASSVWTIGLLMGLLFFSIGVAGLTWVARSGLRRRRLRGKTGQSRITAYLLAPSAGRFLTCRYRRYTPRH